MHVVWVQTGDGGAPTSLSRQPGRADHSQSPSAVGLHLEHLSVTPAVTATGAGAAPSSSPTRVKADDGRDSVGGNGGRGSSSPKRTGVSTGAAGSRSPKTGSGKGASGAPAEKHGVVKQIELKGLSAYTKESTADWFRPRAKGVSPEDRGVLRPTPPHGEQSPSTPAGAASSAPCSTDPVFLLRPVGARGTLVVHEGATVQVAPPSSSESGRPSAGANAGNTGTSAWRGLPGGGAGESSDEHGAQPPPLASVVLGVDEIALQVNLRQYALLNDAVSTLAMSQRRFRFRMDRPTTAVLDDPEAWWRYAIK